MVYFRWVHPEHSDFVARHRLDDLDALLSRVDGQLVTPLHRDRETIRLHLPDGDGQERLLCLKREGQVRLKHVLRRVLLRDGWWTGVRAEFEILQRLASAGVNCPRPIACCQRVSWRSQGALVTTGLSQLQLLNHYLAGSSSAQYPSQREGLFAQVGMEIARLHEAGVFHRRLFANHVYLQASPDDPVAGFLDFRHGHLLRSVSLARRSWDVASLLATLPRRLADERDRDALLDAYVYASDLLHRRMDFLALIDRDLHGLLTQRRIWEIRESDTLEHLAVRPLESVETGKMWTDRCYRTGLEGCGLDTFDKVMSTTRGRRLRALPDRENWRIEVHLPHKPHCGAYLKKHHVRGMGTWVRAKLGAGPGPSAGRIEAQNIARLCRSGIAAMQLISYGEKLHRDGLLESFVMTEELLGFTQLDHFLAVRFPERANVTAARDHSKDQLIREVAAVASKLHRLGYNHRDLYCCHFFIHEGERGKFKVNLIDLQRIEHRKHFRARWLVKDLAQLAYSAPRNRISCTDRMTFIKNYLGVEKLRPKDKRFIRRILAKQRWMERTLGVGG